MKTLGIIDIGSNSIKLIITIINNNSYKEIFHKKFQLRLYNFTDKENKTLSSEGFKNLFDIIFLFKKLCSHYNCDEVVAVATESLRQIKNSSEIVNSINDNLGLKIKILSPMEECYLGYISSIPKDIDDYIHLDMGGGSVEIGLVQNKKLIEYTSIPIGAFKMTNRFHITEKISTDDIYRIERYVFNKLNNISWINKYKHLPAVVIGGSIKTIGRIHQNETNSSNNIHGYELYSEDIEYLLNKINKLSLEEMIKVTGATRTRCDILLGALVTLNSIVTYLSSSKVVISKYTIREGILQYFMNNN